MLAPIKHADFHDAADLLAHADAARAVNAALHLLGRDQGAHGLVEDHPLGLVVARGGFAIPDCQVLQLALAALIAHRAIQRVVDEQEFHDRALRRHGLLGRVYTTMPLVTGVAQAGISLRCFSISTRHMRQLAAMLSFL
ncbi:hypothetical protein CDEF62S_00793 [Castellaniella defragrans]